MKVAAAENAENKAHLQQWLTHWRGRTMAALQPIAKQALGADGDAALARVSARLDARLAKAGLTGAN